MGIQKFETRLERIVEGTFSRLFKSGVSPVEFGRKLVREMDRHRTVGVAGKLMAPNVFEFVISTSDFEQYEDVIATFEKELADAAREHAHDESYQFPGPVEVHIEGSDDTRQGLVKLSARFVEGEPERVSAVLELPTGDQVPLGEYTVTMGRQSDSVVILEDPNVSRRHSEIRPVGDGFAIFDLDSTNGTKVNGNKIGHHQLQDGDEVQLGNTVMHFRVTSGT